MCESSEFITLSETENCQITYCKCCKAFSVAYKSCCTSLLPEELQRFKYELEILDVQDFHYELLGTKMAILRNPHTYMGFCLTREDVNHLLSCISEAETMYDAFQIIYN